MPLIIEVEYVVMIETSKEIIWLQSFLVELNKGQEIDKL